MKEGKLGMWGISGEGWVCYDEKRLKPLGLYCRGGNHIYKDDLEIKTFKIYDLKDKSFVAELTETEFNSNLLKILRKKKLEKIENVQVS